MKIAMLLFLGTFSVWASFGFGEAKDCAGCSTFEGHIKSIAIGPERISIRATSRENTSEQKRFHICEPGSPQPFDTEGTLSTLDAAMKSGQVVRIRSVSAFSSCLEEMQVSVARSP